MSNSNYKAVQNLLDIYDEGDLETKKISNRSSGPVWWFGGNGNFVKNLYAFFPR